MFLRKKLDDVSCRRCVSFYILRDAAGMMSVSVLDRKWRDLAVLRGPRIEVLQCPDSFKTGIDL
jgi:hypothetical protein